MTDRESDIEGGASKGADAKDSEPKDPEMIITPASDGPADEERKLDAINRGLSAEQVLRRRAEASISQSRDAVAQLRAAMSDEEALEDYGIDLTQFPG